jgi:DNA primase
VISPETIDRIRDQANLAEIIGHSVKLQRRGRNLLGLCPFHKEKSPSFNVNEERGFYHCFGCKASGDVFRFVQETEGLTFMEAVRSLAEKLGIEVEDDLSNDERRQRSAEKRREQSFYEVSQAAAVFFEERLEHDENRRFALEELTKRGLPWNVDGRPGPARDTLRAFRVGYAPDTWDALAEHLSKIGHDARAAEAVGLLAPRKSGPGHYDRFRHRLMFAVLDLHGRVVAFSGRALPEIRPREGDAPAKYINSPESPIYKKRATVFGLYQARSALRGGASAALVEGNFDVVSLHAAGFTQTVAPLGTAFTEEQGKLIRRFTQNVAFLFDGDTAGRKATLQSRLPAKEAGLVARVARLPNGTDPDEFLRSRGADQLKRLIDSASGMIDYMIAEILDEGFAAADAVGRADKLRQVTELLAAEDDPNVRALAEQHADRLLGRLGVADAHTFRALKAAVTRTLRAPSSNPSAARPTKARPISREEKLGRAALGALLDFPELLESEEIQPYLASLEGDLAAALACLRVQFGHDHVRSGLEHSEEPSQSLSFKWEARQTSQFLARIPESLCEFAQARIFAPIHNNIDNARVELFANFDKLRRMELTKQSTGTLEDIERARQEGDFDQELELLKEQALRARRRHGL